MNDLTAITEEFGDISAYAKCPPFWVAKPDLGLPLINSLKQATVRVIGKSAGGRDIIAVEYGEKEPLDATCDNLHSVIASKVVPPDPTEIFPDAFYGKTRRRKPVLVLQGAIHGGELTGTVAALNLCRIIERGIDLRGKAWPRLQELARNTRLLIIPWLNIDGVERWPLPNSAGVPLELMTRCTQGVGKDGRKFLYPAVKAMGTLNPAAIRFMGSYYNDNGVNLQYDFCAPRRQSETVAWMEYYLAEKPDGQLIFHCNAGSMIGPPSYYLPVGHQFEETRIAGAVRARLSQEGFRTGRMSWAGLPGLGKPFLEQMAASYHVGGGLPVMCELPCGFRECYFTCEEMLDIGLLTIEEVLAYAHSDGLRPYEFWEKVRKSLAKQAV